MTIIYFRVFIFWRVQQFDFDVQVAPTAQYPSASELKRVYAAAPARTQQQYQQAVTSRLQALTPRPHSAADPFYGPMLARLDAVFSQLGVHDEGCKERVVCSMYKNPLRYSPHSNLVSAELSRWELLLYHITIEFIIYEIHSTIIKLSSYFQRVS